MTGAATHLLRRRLEGIPSVLATLLLLAVARGLEAAEALEDHLSRSWYYTEVVVFQRPAVQDHATGEALARAPAPLPGTLRSFRAPPAERWPVNELPPSTRAFLSFPYLDQSRLPVPDVDDASGFGAPEWSPALEDEAVGVEPPAIAPTLGPDPLLDFLRALAEFEAGLEADSYRWLSPETFTLDAAARRITRRGAFQVLLHGRWLQPVPSREDPQPLLVQVGPRYGDRYTLEGAFDVTLGRYLHFRARLFHTEPLMGHSPIYQALTPREVGSSAPTDRATRALSILDLSPRGFMQLSESRRLRSEELHYLDHPKLGVLVRIEPVPIPEALSQAHLALEEREQ